jgi:Ni2+-binding GTPase involved in maturation of urease and hydrogenase
MVNPGVPFFPISCRTGAGMAEWMAWLVQKAAERS